MSNEPFDALRYGFAEDANTAALKVLIRAAQHFENSTQLTDAGPEYLERLATAVQELVAHPLMAGSGGNAVAAVAIAAIQTIADQGIEPLDAVMKTQLRADGIEGGG